MTPRPVGLRALGVDISSRQKLEGYPPSQ